MSKPNSATDAVRAVGFPLIATAGLFWFLTIVGHIGLSGSDAAGNGMAQGLAAVRTAGFVEGAGGRGNGLVRGHG